MKLTLQEILRLFEELNGIVIDAKTGERGKGLLSAKLSIRVKYILVNELNKKLLEYVKEFEDAKLEIFKELGTLEDGNYVFPNESIEELNRQVLELLSIEKSIDVPNINVEEVFNIETENYFPIFLDKLLAKD